MSRKRHRLTGGTHTRPNGQRIHAGDTFTATEEERDGPLKGRVAPAGKVFTMPDTSGIDWNDDGREDDDDGGA